ncbi:MAG: hypothetical protein FWE14_04205 [Lachnospiraceae bacterium]|nr:hypothetical protein [Lachnospiraceae bacterium]
MKRATIIKLVIVFMIFVGVCIDLKRVNLGAFIDIPSLLIMIIISLIISLIWIIVKPGMKNKKRQVFNNCFVIGGISAGIINIGFIIKQTTSLPSIIFFILIPVFYGILFSLSVQLISKRKTKKLEG